MNKPTLVIMAAGMGSRFGGCKQITPVDDQGHVIMDFSIYDALQAGFGNLSKEQCIAAVEKAGLRPDIRGERLTMENFVTLSDILSEMLAQEAK